jgi:hypothetical protein
MHPLKALAFGIVWFAWTVGCFWMAVRVSDGYDDTIGMLLGILFSGFAFVPAAMAFNRWYELQNPKGNR